MNDIARRPTMTDLQIAAFERESDRRNKQKEANARKAKARKAAGLVAKSVSIHTSHADFFDITLKPMLNKYFASSASPDESAWVKAKIEDVLAEIVRQEHERRADSIQVLRPASPQVMENDGDPFGDTPEMKTGS